MFIRIELMALKSSGVKILFKSRNNYLSSIKKNGIYVIIKIFLTNCKNLCNQISIYKKYIFQHS